MKKIFTASLATLMLCALAACGGNNTSKPTSNSSSTSTPSITPSTSQSTNVNPGVTIAYDFSGVESEAVQHSSYNVFDGVSVLTSTGIELKTRTTATSNCTLNGKLLDTSEIRTCKIDYSVTFKTGGVEITETATRNVEIIEATVTAGNLVSNANFELGTKDWELATHEGGTGEFSVEKTDVMGENKNAAKVVMTGLNWTNASSPRLNSATYATNGSGEDMRFTMTGGQNYKVSFKAKALTTKYVEVSIGQLMPASPWYEGFTSDQQIYTAEVTSTWQEFEYTFTATHATLDGCSILFSMGKVAPTADVMTTLWFTDVYVGVFDGTVVDETAPSFSGMNNIKISESSTKFNVLHGITASDNIDGDVTANIKATYNGNEITTLDVSKAGTYTVNYEVKDAAGNKTTDSRTITVVAAGSNLLPTYNAAKFKEDSWCETWITQSFSDETDGSVKIHTLGKGEQSYVNQINMNNLPCIGGLSYTLTFKIKTSIAMKVAFIQNQNPYTSYAETEISASNDFQTITLNINAAEIDSVNKVTIELGLLADDITFYIKDVKLVQN